MKAVKLGQKAVKAAVEKGESPYLPALDDIIKDFSIRSEVPLGLVDIPLDQIVGTKTVGRQNSFARNFMPIMNPDSEFAVKWMHVYDYQMDSGVADPIVAYEFMNRFYVLEGNKRVSVLKYIHAFSIEGNVTRLVPQWSEDPQVRIFYEFMEFYRRTQINFITMSRPGSYQKLLTLCGPKDTDVWTDDMRMDFTSSYRRFEKVFEEKDGGKYGISCGDAFLMYLSVYPYQDMENITDSQLEEQVNAIWDEISVLKEQPESTLVMKPGEDETAPNIFTRFFTASRVKQLNVAFIHDKPMGNSGWTYSHELGRMHLEEVFKNEVKTMAYFALFDSDNGDERAENMIESAIEDGNQIIFTTSERLLSASLKVAVRHPEIRILNCCVHRPYKNIRSYYGRMYEAKFLEGMAAGAMAANDKIAYRADYPIYGALANINAFALGASSVNPRARVYLNWIGEKNADFSDMIAKNDIHVISDVDTIRPDDKNRRYGLYIYGNGMAANLAAPIWNWGKFYEKIIRDIVSGSWNSTAKKGALNYWWGISGGIIDLITSKNMPEGIHTLIDQIRGQIYSENFHPFQGVIYKQDGSTAGSKDTVLSPEEIITMDYLCSNVIGRIPGVEDLTEEARKIVSVQGVGTA